MGKFLSEKASKFSYDSKTRIIEDAKYQSIQSFEKILPSEFPG